MRVVVNNKGYEIDGELYPRVTKILGNLPKPALVPWAAKCVAEFAVQHKSSWMGLPEAAAIRMLKTEPMQQRDDAAAAGTAVHKAVEAHVTGQESPGELGEREAKIFAHAQRFLDDYKPVVLHSELTIFADNPDRYAGTMDMHCLIDGVRYICDFKTSKGVYPDYALQLSLYARAEWAIVQNEKQEWYGLNGQEPPRLAIVHLLPTGYKFYDVTADADLMYRTSTALFTIEEWQKSNAVAIKARVDIPSAKAVAAAEADKAAGVVWESL